jgi:hypothetical protein
MSGTSGPLAGVTVEVIKIVVRSMTRTRSDNRRRPNYETFDGGGSRQIGQRPPFFGNARCDRRNRNLGKTAGDEGREDHAERFFVAIVGRTGQHKAEAADVLHPGRNTGIGWFEAKVVPAFDGHYLFAEAASQREEIVRASVGGDPSAEAPQGVRGKRRRYEEAPRLEVWIRVHESPFKTRAGRLRRVWAISMDHRSIPADARGKEPK